MFKDLLDEIKVFKYQITVKFLLRKHKEKEGIKFAPVYFNSTTKTVINSKYVLDKYFQKLLYRIDNWINEGSGWVIESIDAEYVNVSGFRTLAGSTYVELPCRLKISMKGLINIKNNDNTWHLNPLKIHHQRITKADKIMVNDLIMKTLSFLSVKKMWARLKRKIIFALMCFAMKII